MACVFKFVIWVGYSGYVPGVASENCFGKTYGETSKDSATNKICRGRDLPSNLKYTTMMKAAHDDLTQVKASTTAEIVGVPPGKHTYAKVRDTLTFSQFLKFE